jgi:UDP-N-acetylmuramate dehydrogenase
VNIHDIWRLTAFYARLVFPMNNRDQLQHIIDLCSRDLARFPEFHFDEPMYRHTTFRTGGPADLWIRPGKDIFPDFVAALLKAAKAEEIPVFILGAGANILVSDRGIRGMVLDTGSWKGVGKREDREVPADARAGFAVKVNSGTSVDGLVDRLMIRGLSGLEFLAGMPGSVGGAVWMNARCYDRSIAGALLETEILDEDFVRRRVPFKAEDFGYKKSPFQKMDALILSARFKLTPGSTAAIRQEMDAHRRDREEKGHYRLPSAGSAFKNNRAFGAPTGKIIDELGLRGFSIGGASIAPWHGNIIVNTGGASSSDIRALVDAVTEKVKALRGFDLEPEILFSGQW